MARKGSRSKLLIHGSPEDLEQMKIATSMFDQPDYIVVLLSVAILEHVLGAAIAQHFTPSMPEAHLATLFEDGGNGPLATFSAKCRIAFALGVFGEKTNRDLQRIRTIRNAFAHPPRPIDFATAEIRRQCETLEAASQNSGDARQRFIVAFLVYWGAFRGYRLNDSSLVGAKFRIDLS